MPLGTRVPHPTTLMKITSRCGTDAIDGLNEALLAKAHGDKLIRLDKVRADTTVVEANVAYPTDSGLLAKGVAKLGRLAAQVKAAGLATRTTFRDRTRSVRRRAHDIGAWLRRRNDDAKAEVRKINAEMAGIAERTVADARHVAANARRGLAHARSSGDGQDRGVDRRAGTHRRAWSSGSPPRPVSGSPAKTPDGSTRIVSLHDPDARPIAKGRLGRPVEFGYKAQVVDNVDGIVVDHSVACRQPARRPACSCPPSPGSSARFGRAPRAVTADRGYGEAAIDARPRALGVTRVVIPRKGRPGAARQHVAASTVVPQAGQVAHRQRSPHLLPQTRLRVAAHPHRRRDRRRHLVRLGRARPQRHQDQRPHPRSRTTTGRPGHHPGTTRNGGRLRAAPVSQRVQVALGAPEATADTARQQGQGRPHAAPGARPLSTSPWPPPQASGSYFFRSK